MSKYDPQDDVRELPRGTALAILSDPASHIKYVDVGGQRGEILVYFAVGLLLVLSAWGLIAWAGNAAAAISDPYGETPALAEDFMADYTEQPTATEYPTATPEPTATPVPTRDYVAEAELAFKITQQEATQIVVNRQIAADQKHDAQTQAADEATAEARKTQSAGTATAQTEMGILNLSAARTAVSAQATTEAELRAVEIQSATRKADLDYVSSIIIDCLIALAMLVVIIGGGWAARWYVAAKMAETAIYRGVGTPVRNDEETPVPAPAVKAGDIVVKLDRRDASGLGAVDITTCPIDENTLHRVANLIVLGHARYTEAAMTGAENPLIKDGTFDDFGKWMVVNRIAMQLPNKSYVISNRQFFEKFV